MPKTAKSAGNPALQAFYKEMRRLKAYGLDASTPHRPEVGVRACKGCLSAWKPDLTYPHTCGVK